MEDDAIKTIRDFSKIQQKYIPKEQKSTFYVKEDKQEKKVDLTCISCNSAIQRCKTCSRLSPKYSPEYQLSLTFSAGYCSNRCERASDLNVTLKQLENNENGVVQIPPPLDWELEQITKEYREKRRAKGLRV